jgi:hypothetical protein
MSDNSRVFGSREAQVQEVLTCLRESLREPVFATVLAVLVAGKRHAGLDHSADSDVAEADR